MADVYRGGDDYHTLFDPNSYLKNYHTETCDNWTLVINYMESLHKIYREGKVKGKRIIDIGCGPSFHPLIPAAKWFDELYLADFSQKNLDVIQKWLVKDPDSFSWEPHFRFFAEKHGNRYTRQEYENALRAKLKRTLLCDFFKSNPLDPESLGDFDAVSTCTALMSGCKTVDQYKDAMKNIASLIKPGGFLIEIAVIGSTWYIVGTEKFSNVPVCRDDVLRSFKEAGFEVLQSFEDKRLLKTDVAVSLGSLTVLGKKIC